MADDSAQLPPLGQNLDPYAYLRQGYTLTFPAWDSGHNRPRVRKAVSTLPVGPVQTGALAFPWTGP